MKLTKKLLLVLASTLLLAGCGDKEECPQCEQCQTCEQCQHSPTPGDGSLIEDIIYRYKQLLTEEFNVIFDACGDHLDRNEFSDSVESLLEWLDEVTSEEEAYTLAGTIRDEFHNAILPILRDNLWNEFDGFVANVNASISSEFKYIKDEAFVATQDTIRDIKAATYYEDALNIYDGAVSNVINVCIFEFRSWGVNKLLDVYTEYRSVFPEKTPERQMIDIEYNTVRSYIVNEAFTISNVESRVKEHINNFTSYCEEISAVE